jgi:hypothetical protein
MTEPTYSLKEIIELQFSNQAKELGDIKQLLKDQNIQFEKRFAQIEKDIDDLRMDNARYKMIIGVGATLGATVFTFLLNRIF